MRILAFGDIHHPDRASFSSKVLKLLKEKHLPDVVVVTGDLTSEEVLREIRETFTESEIYIVRGNMDRLPLKEFETFKIGRFRFLVYHGHGIKPRGDLEKLKRLCLDLNANVLITGHTHKPLYYHDKVHIINPGSLTGAYSGEDPNIMFRSYAIIDTDGKNLDVRIILNSKE